MEPLNFCRQITRQFSETMARKQVVPFIKKDMINAIDLCQLSTKFIMPENGVVIHDEEFRGLENVKYLNLPYKHIALEYTKTKIEATEDMSPCSKSVVIARQYENMIFVSPVPYNDKYKQWFPMPTVLIMADDYMLDGERFDSGSPKFKFRKEPGVQLNFPASDYTDELGILLHFLNALSCSNVRPEKLPRRIPKKLKSALPFDDYHVLTVDCPKRHMAAAGHHIDERRHPREHLRRGHIRRLENGSRIWVNSTIVNHGVGGKISKDYGVRDPRAKMIEALSR
jgi:hypothetical protein